MKCLRRIVGKTKPDRVRNDRIREELHIKAVETTINERILSWYGHLLRMDENRKPHQYMEARAQGRRPTDRPRVTWEATVSRIAAERGKTVNQLQRMATDREQWRRWIRGDYPTL
ncbi:uncharacterized protein LOC120352002 [Nilaparvata lugens]|uniref:uncharacterized protein LOC120352002 n=1 Tax=Nilaparvata lugens TaxID=108931 RepID=UPI00193D6378|nr:uncharacterized protein LOC120352002 [Nilaparvata lugens]